MYNIYLLSIQNLRTYIHDIIMRTAIIFAFASILIGHLLGDIISQHHIAFTSSFGLLVINLFSAFITIHVGCHTIHKDLLNNTIATLVSVNISRTEIFLAKYLAILLMNLINISMMLALFILLIFLNNELAYQYFIAVYMIFIELILLSAIVIFLNTFTKSIVTFYSAASLYIAGHYSGILINLEQITNIEIIKYLGKIMFYLTPNFHIFSTSHFIVNSSSISIEHLLPGTIYCVFYSSIFLFLGYMIFSKRNL